MVFVGLAVKVRFDKFMARHTKHGVEHALVAHATRAKLEFDHLLPSKSQRVEFSLRIHGLMIMGGIMLEHYRLRTSYFLRRRMRISKLTTPFWSRVPTTETLRVK